MIVGTYLALGLVAVTAAAVGWWHWAEVRGQRTRDRFQEQYRHCGTTTALLPATLTSRPAGTGVPPTHASSLGNQRPHRSPLIYGATGNGGVTARRARST